jgi:hypothetical protein
VLNCPQRGLGPDVVSLLLAQAEESKLSLAQTVISVTTRVWIVCDSTIYYPGREGRRHPALQNTIVHLLAKYKGRKAYCGPFWRGGKTRRSVAF